MKAVVDRIVQYANRYKLTDVNTGDVLGTFDFDEVTGTVQQVGTEIDKELFDSIADDLATRLVANGGDSKNVVVTFSEATTFANIVSGESHSTLFGKLRKWFTDRINKLKAFAYDSSTKITSSDVDSTIPSTEALENGDITVLNAEYSNSASRAIADKNGKDITTYVATETDPTVPGWAKNATKPTYTKEEVGLGNVDNTSDEDKPISTATKNALSAKVDKVSGKQLSTNDYTTGEKIKLAQLITDAVSYGGEQRLTDTQKSQARTNIGAGTSDFSGTWEDLTGKPSIEQTSGDSEEALMSQKAITDLIENSTSKVIQLTNEDLNTLYGDDKVGTYYADSTNTCSNLPEHSLTLASFALSVEKAGASEFSDKYLQKIAITGLKQLKLVTLYFYRIVAGDWIQVNNANPNELTIKVNNEVVGTYEASGTEASTINIEVPSTDNCVDLSSDQEISGEKTFKDKIDLQGSVYAKGKAGTMGQVLFSDGMSEVHWRDLNAHNAEEIVEGKDLNDVVYQGWYFGRGIDNPNLPDGFSDDASTGWTLEVLLDGNNLYLQILRTVDSCYFRGQSVESGYWLDWHKIALAEYVVDLESNQTIGGTKAFAGSISIGDYYNSWNEGSMHISGDTFYAYSRKTGLNPIDYQTSKAGYGILSLGSAETENECCLELNEKVGEVGQVLTSQGDGKTPCWTTPVKESLMPRIELAGVKMKNYYEEYRTNDEHGLNNYIFTGKDQAILFSVKVISGEVKADDELCLLEIQKHQKYNRTSRTSCDGKIHWKKKAIVSNPIYTTLPAVGDVPQTTLFTLSYDCTQRIYNIEHNYSKKHLRFLRQNASGAGSNIKIKYLAIRRKFYNENGDCIDCLYSNLIPIRYTCSLFSWEYLGEEIDAYRFSMWQ